MLDPTSPQSSGPIGTGMSLGVSDGLFPVINDEQKLYRPATNFVGQDCVTCMRRSAFNSVGVGSITVICRKTNASRVYDHAPVVKRHHPLEMRMAAEDRSRIDSSRPVLDFLASGLTKPLLRHGLEKVGQVVVWRVIIPRFGGHAGLAGQAVLGLLGG